MILKRYIIYFLVFITLCTTSCEKTPSTDGVKQWAKEKLTAMIDDLSAEPVVIQTVRSYEKVQLENPASYVLNGAIANDIYTDGNTVCVPTGNFMTTGNIGLTILQYDNSGVLTAEIPVPDIPGTSIIEVRTLSDGRFVFYGESEIGNHNDTFVAVTDAAGNTLHRVELPRHDVSIINAIFNNCTGMDVYEDEDGSVRIFINAWNCAYYFDGTLTQLNAVPFNGEYENIYRISDGVYVLGKSMPAVVRVDMNEGTIKVFDHLDLSIPPEMIYFSDVFYTESGQQYCVYDGVLYRCDGNKTVTEIMRWENGSCTGNGLFWILDDHTVYYQAQTNDTISGYANLVLLKIFDDSTINDRYVISLVNMTNINRDWLYEVIAHFNAENEQYYVEIRDYRENGAEQLREDFLTDVKTDIIIASSQYILQDYQDKGVLLDLAPFLREQIPDGVFNAYALSDKLFFMPLAVELETFVSASTVFDEVLTWDAVKQLEAKLQNGGMKALTSNPSAADWIFDLSLCDFYDAENAAATFDTALFNERIQFLERLRKDYTVEDYGFLRKNILSNDMYALSHQYIVDAVLCGEVGCFTVPIETVSVLGTLQLLFDETGYTFCGLPSDTGIGASITASNVLSVIAESDVLGGVQELLDFLLSDAVQTSAYLTENALPVTRSALEKTLAEYRFLYYDSSLFHSVTGFGGASGISVHAIDHSSQYSEEKSRNRTVIEISDAEQEAFLRFFDRISALTPDPTVKSIVSEELSAYESGAKSLDEVSKLIQSRVWIYLNE